MITQLKCSGSSKRKQYELNLSSSLSDDNCEETIVDRKKKMYRKSYVLFNKPRTTSLTIDTDDNVSSSDSDADWSDDTTDGDGSISMSLQCDCDFEEELQIFQNLLISQTPRTSEESLLQTTLLGLNMLTKKIDGKQEYVEPMDIENDSKMLKVREVESEEESRSEINGTHWENESYCDGCVNSSRCDKVKPSQKRIQSYNFDEDPKRGSRRYCKNLYNPKVKSSTNGCDLYDKFLYGKKKNRKTSNTRKKQPIDLAKILRYLPSSSDIKDGVLFKNE